jgi:predicted PurR-regulated permease PerM
VTAQRLSLWLSALATVLAAAAVLWLAWRVLAALAPAVAVTAAGAVLATLLQPLADRVQRMVRSRPLAAFAVIVLVLAPFAVLAAALLTVVLRQAQGLLRQLPSLLAQTSRLLLRLQDYLQVHLHIRLDLATSLGAGHGPGGLSAGLAQSLAQAGGGVLRDSIGILSGLVNITVDSVLALVVAFFLLWDGRAILTSALDHLPAELTPTARELSRIVGRVVAAYFRGQVLVGAIFGLMIGLSMFALGLPDAALLGFLAGLFEMIPTVGPILASIGPILLSLTLPHPNLLWVLVVLVAAQQVESNLLVPRVSGGIVGLHPLTVILGVFAGFNLAGVAGALLAVPAAAVGREIVRRWWRPSTPTPAPAPAATRVGPRPGASPVRRAKARGGGDSA